VRRLFPSLPYSDARKCSTARCKATLSNSSGQARAVCATQSAPHGVDEGEGEH
jgi:hypothetical protein